MSHMIVIVRVKIIIMDHGSHTAHDDGRSHTIVAFTIAGATQLSGEHVFNDCAGGHQGGHCVVHDRFCKPADLGEADSEDHGLCVQGFP